MFRVFAFSRFSGSSYAPIAAHNTVDAALSSFGSIFPLVTLLALVPKALHLRAHNTVVHSKGMRNGRDAVENSLQDQQRRRATVTEHLQDVPYRQVRFVSYNICLFIFTFLLLVAFVRRRQAREARAKAKADARRRKGKSREL